MSNGARKLFSAVTQEGEVVIEGFGPPNALMNGADGLSKALYALSELLIRGVGPKQRGGFFGGEFGYGMDYENDVFLMHPDYEDAQIELPNFWYKPLDLKVTWYKYIGRDMEPSRSITDEEFRAMLTACWESIPERAHEYAKAQLIYEARLEREEEEEPPELKQKREFYANAFLAHMSSDLPCWVCTKFARGQGFGARLDDGSQIGGSFHSGAGEVIVSTWRNKYGACRNCDHVTTDEEMAILRQTRR